MGAVNLLFGFAPFTDLPSESLSPGVHGFPVQSMPDSGTGPSAPSHQTVLSDLSKTFV